MRAQPPPRDPETVTNARNPIQEEEIMVRYFYAWSPLVIVGTVVFLSLPWLGLIALLIVSLVALAALAAAIVLVPYMLARAIGHLWHGLSSASPQTATALSPARRQNAMPAFRKGAVS
jgi:hypothetical protein